MFLIVSQKRPWILHHLSIPTPCCVPFSMASRAVFMRTSAADKARQVSSLIWNSCDLRCVGVVMYARKNVLSMRNCEFTVLRACQHSATRFKWHKSEGRNDGTRTWSQTLRLAPALDYSENIREWKASSTWQGLFCSHGKLSSKKLRLGPDRSRGHGRVWHLEGESHYLCSAIQGK